MAREYFMVEGGDHYEPAVEVYYYFSEKLAHKKEKEISKLWGWSSVITFTFEDDKIYRRKNDNT